MSQWFFLMESLSELDGGLTGRLGATLHTTGPCVFGKETPPPEDPMELRGRSDLKGELSRSLMGPTSELISIGRTSWLSAFRLVWKHLRRSRIPGQKQTRMEKKGFCQVKTHWLPVGVLDADRLLLLLLLLPDVSLPDANKQRHQEEEPQHAGADLHHLHVADQRRNLK